MSVSDISKTLIYYFNYKAMKRKLKEKAQILFTDTDSLCYHIKMNDSDEERLKDDKYDTSNYPKEHRIYSAKYKKQLGKNER